jgi:AraC-like DNA-binding protein/quercetin dioxygenase-like cupin family protein
MSIIRFDKKNSFDLKMMEFIFDESKGMPDSPHRHNYYTIIWPTKSVKGKHRIDFNEYPIRRNKLFFIQPGQVHQLVTKERPEGFVILFGSDFLVKAKIEKSFIDNLKIFNSFLYNEPLSIDTQKEKKLNLFVNSMYEETNSLSKYRDETLGAYLKLFLIECTSGCTAEIEKDANKSKLIIDEFKRLVEKKFDKEHLVKFYADKLLLSSGHLNFSVKKDLGITAKKYIQERITLEAKRHLLYSNFSAKETAFKLGFKDPHHFSKFIKKQTGLTITQFIENYRN